MPKPPKGLNWNLGQPTGVPDLPLEQPMLCPECERQLPASSFERLPGDRRCKYCIAAANARKAEEEQRRIAEKAVGEVHQALRLPSSESKVRSNKIIESAVCTLARHTDPKKAAQEFGRIWGEQIQQAIEKRPGSVGTIQVMSQFVKHVRESEKSENERDLAELTDRELALRERQLVADLLKDVMAGKQERSAALMLCQCLNQNPMEAFPTLFRDESDIVDAQSRIVESEAEGESNG